MPFPPGKPEPDKAFRVVIAYEDYVAGSSALDAQRLLMSRFGRDLDFHISFWSFELLQSTQVNLTAIQAAIDADAIVVATHQRDELPRAIKDWVEAWLPQKREQIAVLIALFDFAAGPAGASSSTSDYLKNAAARAGLDFLVQQTPPARNGSWSSPVFQDSGIRPAPEGWGLND